MSKMVQIADENHEWAKSEAKKHGLSLGRFIDHVVDFFRDRSDSVKLEAGFREEPTTDEEDAA